MRELFCEGDRVTRGVTLEACWAAYVNHFIVQNALDYFGVED